MRITNNIIQQTSVANVQRNMRDMYRAQERVTTGRKVNRASDEPVGASISMQTRTSIRALEQYRRGIDIANSRAQMEETILDRLGDMLSRAKEVAMATANDSVTPEQRQFAAYEIEELLREAVSLGNSRYGDTYLFAGSGENAAPFGTVTVGNELHFTSTSPTGNIYIEVSSHHSVPANHSGTEVFEDTGVLTSLRDLAIALKSGDGQQVADAVPALDQAFEQIQHLIGGIGSQSSSLQITSANIQALSNGLEVLKSDVEDVEIETAITDLLGRQTAYQAALMTTSRIMGMTLADYLR